MIPQVLRRLAIGLAGLALAILAGAACVLSFDDLRELALQGRAEPRFAYLYPAGFDALLIVALISVPLLRSGRILVRIQVSAILVLLLAVAATATVATATGTTFEPRQVAITVALVPWVMLVIGLWLLLVLVKHTQARREDLNGDNEDDELVPFDKDDSRPITVPQADTVPSPVISPVRHTPPDAHISAEAAAPPDYAPPVPVSPVAETVAPPELAPPLPPVAEKPVPDEPDEPEPPRRPTRWGDLIRPNVGDVLVHPRRATPPADADEEPEPTPDDPAFADYANQDDPARTGERSETTASHSADDQADATYWASTPDHVPPPASETPNEEAASAQTPSKSADEELEDTQPHQTIPDDAETPRAVPVLASDDAASEALSRRYDEAAAQIAARFSGSPEKAAEESGTISGPSETAVISSPVSSGPSETAVTSSEVVEEGVDTQPIRKVRESPDPEHGVDAADAEELDLAARRQPYGADVPAPPSGRMRSTPLPPGD
ncbi:DUF2637 domain-containing protein [Acrocarpospora phusangensis]|uniref:DUF2637 domain-containing protein n=1 Tax=Acrocarpospora phusangensis TaxID=1070424 RepID=UPI00194E32C3|nr:DUF2637 domain-containing protein [Acrocarpospora phusangensis]